MAKQRKSIASVKHLRELALKGAHGKDWYAKAQKSIEAYCEREGIMADWFADVLAITSPRVQLARNVALAQNYADTGNIDGMLQSTVAAIGHWVETGEIRGPKTGPFAEALKGNESAIVLDTWMAKAFKLSHKEMYWVAHWGECLRRVGIVAKQLGWSPREVQAAIWHGVQGLTETNYLEIE